MQAHIGTGLVPAAASHLTLKHISKEEEMQWRQIVPWHALLKGEKRNRTSQNLEGKESVTEISMRTTCIPVEICKKYKNQTLQGLKE